MTERREMADIYRSEMCLHNEVIRERARNYNPRVRDEQRSNDDYVTRGNAEEFRTLPQIHDDGLSIRDFAASRFQWNCLLNESKGGLRSNVVREDSRFASRDQNYDGLVERSLPLASVRTRNVLTYDPNVGGSGYYGRSRNLTGLPIEDGRNYMVRERGYPLRMERESFRQPNDDGNGLRFLLEDGSHSSTPLAHSSGQRTPFRGIAMEGLPQEVHYPSADGIGTGGRLMLSRSSSYHRIPYSNAGRTSYRLSAEGVSPRGEYNPNVRRLDDYIHPENQRSWNCCLKTVPKDAYDDDHNVQDYNDQGGPFGTDVVNATLPRHHNARYYHRDVVEDVYSPPQNFSHPLQEASTLDNCGGSRIAFETVYGVGDLNFGRRDSYLDHRTEDIHGTPSREEQFPYERNACGMLYEGEYVYSPRQNERVSLMDENIRQILETREFTLPEQSSTARKRRHGCVDQMSDAKRRTICLRGSSSCDYRHLSVDDEEELGFSRKFTRQHDDPHSRADTGMFDNEARHTSADFCKSLQRPLRKPQESGRGDVKKRLKYPQAVSRPSAPQLLWQQEAKSRIKPPPNVSYTTTVKTFGKAKGTDFKKKLKSVPKPVSFPSVAPDHVVLHSRLNKKQQQELPTKDLGSTNDPLCSLNVDPDQSVLKVKPLEDLPEDSKKFKQWVDEWFLKCMELLNGNIDRQKRFKGKGIGSKLNCIICSSYKEFVETKDVAMHAFLSPKVGYRAQHLGFHRALCVLMGWDRAVAPNGRWVCKSLPELVAWTLKEDIIIWPPVVIIHNNPAGNYQLNEPGNVSIKLENILREKGFTSEIKGCHENPGSPNIMVAKFNGTLPGLKEAERLHNFFAGNKHGRAELGQICPEVVCCEVVDKKPENERKLVDKREDDRKPVDKTKDEQPKYKTEDFRKLIDKSEDDDELLEKTKVDQQPLDKPEDDHEPVDKARNEQESLGKARDDQDSLDNAQDDQEPLGKAREDQEPSYKRQNYEGPADQTEDDQELVNKTEDDSVPLVKTSDDSVPIDKTEDDQEPLDKVEHAQEPVGKAKNDQAPVGKTEETLYGYLGIIEDLSKLHNDMKRHHLARSKKEILASFNALM